MVTLGRTTDAAQAPKTNLFSARLKGDDPDSVFLLASLSLIKHIVSILKAKPNAKPWMRHA
jgi:hypothetical protein